MAKAKKSEVPKPRNFVTIALSKRAAGAGAHGKSKKAQRTADKVALKKDVAEAEDETKFPMLEAANHLGEKTYNSFASWKAACKKANPNVTFEGDKDICNAKPGVGEWDGETGCVYTKKAVAEATKEIGPAKKKHIKYADWKKAASECHDDIRFISIPGDKEKTMYAKHGDKTVGEWKNLSGWVYESFDEFDAQAEDEQDTVTMDVPLLIRMFEVMREEVESDEELHDVVERILSLKNRGVLTMNDYEEIIPTEPNGDGEEW